MEYFIKGIETLFSYNIRSVFTVKHIFIISLLFSQALTSSSFAQDDKIQVHIPENLLEDALIEYSILYKRVIIGQPSILKGYRSLELNGSYNAEQALNILLSNSNLIAKPKGNYGFVLKEKPTPSTQKEEPIIQSSVHEEMFVLAPPPNMRSTLNATANSHLDSEFIAENRIVSVQSMSTNTPNLTVTPTTLGFLNVNIRGIMDYGNTFQGNQSIPLHYNGHVQTATQNVGLILFDLEDIDVSRGPQITQTGRSAIGGSIYIHSTPAKIDNADSYIDLSIGNYNLKNYEAAFNIPIANEFAIRVAGMREMRDGYINIWDNYDRVEHRNGEPYNYQPVNTQTDTNTYDGENYDNSDKSAIRISAAWKPSENTDIHAHWETQKNRSLPTAAIDPYIVKHYERALVIDSPAKQFSKKTMSGLTLEHSFSDIGVSYYLRHSTNEYESVADIDFGNYLSEDPQHDEYHRRAPKQTQLSHNIELHTVDTKNKLQWLAGIYYEDFDLSRQVSIADYSLGDEASLYRVGLMSIDPERSSRNKDVYGLIKYQITPSWSINTGGRYIKNRRDIGQSDMIICWATNIIGPHPTNLNSRWQNIDLERASGEAILNHLEEVPNVLPADACFQSPTDPYSYKSEKFTYQIGSSVELSEDLSTQLTYNTGYRPGETRGEFTFSDQTSRNLELGFTGEAFDNRLTFNTSAFYTEHENIISEEARMGFDAEVYGIELSISSDYVFGGTLELSGAYLNTSITKLDRQWEVGGFNGSIWNPPSSSPELAAQGYVDLSGNRLPNSPKYSITLDYKYPFDSTFGTWTPRILIKSVSDYYLDIANSGDHSIVENGQEINFNNISRQPAYTTVDLSLEWQSRSGKFGSKLAVYNATDEDIRISATDNFYSNEGQSSIFAEPRVIMLTLSYQYE